MQNRPDTPVEDENWADYIDRLRVFEPPTHRTRRAAWRLEHPAETSPPVSPEPSPGAADTVRR